MSENLYYQTIAKGGTFFYQKLEELALLENISSSYKENTLSKIIHLFDLGHLYDDFTFRLFESHSIIAERCAYNDFSQILRPIIEKTFKKKFFCPVKRIF